jgi:hypothetical protein
MGQMLMSIGALLLLTLTVLRVNNTILQTDTIMQESKFGILATSIATSLIEKASKKAYDANTFEDAVSDKSELTPATSLGPNSDENTPDEFNDFDDFNGYTEQISNLPSATYDVSCEVCYINPNVPDGKLNTQSWHKRMTVKVSSPFSQDTVKLSTIFSYWHFR